MLGKGFFFTESHNPDFPPETYDDLVYENTTAGNYSTALDWGKYKIVFSGGGGSGAAVVRHTHAHNMEFAFCENGYAAAEETVYLNVMGGEIKTLSGVVGSGGGGSTVSIDENGFSYDCTATYGNPGTGYENGNHANTKYEYDHTSYQPETTVNAGAWVGGNGGGSTSIAVNGVVQATAKGGDGGNVRINYSGYKTSTGGTGGSGGTKTGTGASGGSSVSVRSDNTTRTSGAGSNGYIRIYKSNLKPEPL